eukprot:TRINITY_DN3312_c2_g1_i2.p1 TRINITY_DN3312_c2_g1~~TRINITY_DN3312_c2_g1_i2.p1  ORF type:complete len:391 (+),score=42.14 TRINITY_DN3312_c2_g1_i2:41-1174(+)
MRPEGRVLRNTAVTALLFAVLKIVRKLRYGGKKKVTTGEPPKFKLPPLEPLGEWEELLKCSAGIGSSTAVYELVKRIAGQRVAAVASVGPLRYFLDDPRFRISFKFLIAFITGQVIISLLPVLKKYPLLLMFPSTSQLLSWWLYADEGLPRDYINFLYGMGKIERNRVLSFRKLLFEGGKNKDWKPYCFPKAEGGQWEFDDNDPISMIKAMLNYFMDHMKGTVPFYVKIYAFRLLFYFLAGSAKAQVKTRMTGLITDIFRSSVFLSAYCTTAYVSLTGLVTLLPEKDCNPVTLWIALSLPALALIVESKSQQRTISFYCATFGVYPVLQKFGLFDIAGVLSAAAVGSGRAVPPLPLRLIWGESPGQVSKVVKEVATK